MCRANASAVATHVEISPSNCIFGSQIILHTRCLMPCWSIVFFFFQAEDGIRDLTVTGVQTCALPISSCAGLRLRSRPDSRATMVAARLSSTAISEGSSLMARHPNRNLTFVLLLASFELDVRTVNERNTDPLKKRSLLVSCTLESEAWRGTGTRRHGGRHETPA